MASINIEIFFKQVGGEVLKQIRNDIQGTKTALADLRQASAELVSSGAGLTAFGAALTSVLAVPVKFASDFEAEISKIRALLTQSTDGPEELARAINAITEKAEELGRTTQFTANEAAQGLFFLAKAGFDVEQSLAAIGPVLNLAAVEGISLGTAADVATNIMSAFGLQAEETARAVDAISGVSNNANTNLLELGEAMKTSGALAGLLNLSLEDVTAVLGAVANAGQKGSEAGTGLKNVIVQLASGSEQTSEALKKLRTQAFIDGEFVGFKSLIQQLTDGMENLSSSADKSALLIQAFGLRGGPFIANLLKQGVDAIAKLENEARNTGNAAQIAEERLNNLAGSFTKLKSATEGFLISTGTPFLGKIKDFVDVITEFVSSLNTALDNLGDLRTVVVGTAGGIGILAVAIGGLLTATGLLGLSVVAVKVGIAALGLTAGSFVLQMGLLIAVVYLAIKLFKDDWGKSLKIAGNSLQNWIEIVLIQIIIWKEKFLKILDVVQKTMKRVFTLGFGDTSKFDESINKRIKKIKEFERAIRDLEEGPEKTEEKKLARIAGAGNIAGAFPNGSAANLAANVKKIDVDAADTEVNINNLELPKLDFNFLDFEKSTQIVKKTEENLALFVEEVQTRFAELDSAKRRGLKTDVEVASVRRALLKEINEKEIALLKEKLELSDDENEKVQIGIEIKRSEEKLKRDLISLSDQEFDAAERARKERQELDRFLTDLESRSLDGSLSSLKRKHELEIIEVQRRHEQEIEDLKKKEATVQEIEFASQQQRKEIANIRLNHIKEIRNKEIDITRELNNIERQSLGQSINDQRRKNEIELEEYVATQEDKIRFLIESGATEDQISKARIDSELAINRRRGDLDRQTLQQSMDLQDRLREIQLRSLGPGNLEERHELELQALQDKHARELEMLRQHGADKDQILQAQLAHEREMQELTTQQTFDAIQTRIRGIQTVTSGLSDLLQAAFDATGRKSKELFALSQTAAIAQATANVALGITEALKLGPILAPIMIPIVAVRGALEIAKIKAQSFATGGFVHGGSGYKDDVPIWAMGGEYMINRDATSYYSPSLMEAFNQKLVPRDMAMNLMSSLPSPKAPPANNAFAMGGPVPTAPNFGETQTKRPITFVTVTDEQMVDRRIASSAGDDIFLNKANQLKEPLKMILSE